MLRLPYSLLFPSLTHQGEISFKNLQSNAKTRIFSLDWDKPEEEKYTRWANQFDVSPYPVNYCDVLPEGLKDWTTKMLFALSETYLQEIRHCSFKAAEEWSRKKPVATLTKDPAVGPAVAYVNTAFHLLADCLYDPETNYYSRSGTKLIAPYVLLYRFWAYQVPYNSVMAFTGLQELQSLLEGLKADEPETFMMGTQTIQEISKHYSFLEENHYWTRREEAKSEGTLTDFLTNRTGTINVSNITLTLPVIGELTLISPKLKRSRGEITLTAEFRSTDTSRVLQLLPDYSNPFDFTLNVGKDPESAVMAWGATITGITTTPPPALSIRIHRLGSNEPKTDKEIKKIDLEKVKLAREQAIQYSEEDR